MYMYICIERHGSRYSYYICIRILLLCSTPRILLLCVRILLRNMCPHTTTIYVSAYYSYCYYMSPHTTIMYVSSCYYNIRVLMLLPHDRIWLAANASVYYHTCVRVMYSIRVRMLLLHNFIRVAGDASIYSSAGARSRRAPPPLPPAEVSRRGGRRRRRDGGRKGGCGGGW